MQRPVQRLAELGHVIFGPGRCFPLLWHHPLAQLLSDTLPLLLEIGQDPFSRAATNPGLSSDEVVLFAQTYCFEVFNEKVGS